MTHTHTEYLFLMSKIQMGIVKWIIVKSFCLVIFIQEKVSIVCTLSKVRRVRLEVGDIYVKYIGNVSTL